MKAIWRWLLVLAFGALFWFLISRATELASVARTLEQGRWQWLLAAACCQVAYYGLYAVDYQAAFRASGLPEPAYQLLPVLLSSLALGEVAPLGWVAGSAVFIRYCVVRGETPERAAVGTLLAQTADLTAFSFVFVAGLAFLFQQHHLRPYEAAGTVLLLFMNAASLTVLALAAWRPDLLPMTAYKFLPIALYKGPDTASRAQHFASALAEAALQVRSHPRQIGVALAAALGGQAANLFSLFLVFEAFRQPIGFSALVAGYGVGTMTWMLSPVPTGIGVVEGATALVYVSLGVAAGKAAVIAVAYRGLSFWLPLLAGLLCLRRLAAPPPD